MSNIVRYITLFILTFNLSPAQKVEKVTPNVNYIVSDILWTPSNKPISTSPKKLSKGEQMLIQIFLDEHDFGPGIIDGAIGGFTRKAIQAYYDTIGYDDYDDLSVVLEHAFAHKNVPFITISVPDMGEGFTNPELPYKYRLMAEEKKATYRYYHEFIAERYGEWVVKNSVPNPVWRYDPLVLKGEGRSEESEVYNVPGGPNNPVGVLWNGLSARSVGIHGTNQPETIGRTRSSGCIRMANWDVVKLPNYIRPGCKVIIK